MINDSASFFKSEIFSFAEKISSKNEKNFETFSASASMWSHYEHFAWEELNGYVTGLHNNVWWIAYILEKDAENSMECVSFLHPKGPSKLFYFPENDDVLHLPKDDVLTKVTPTTVT